MLTTENGRLSMIGLFPVPDGVPFDRDDIQQMIMFREPLAVLVGGDSSDSVITGIGNLTSLYTVQKHSSSSVSGIGVLPLTVSINKITSSVITGIGTTPISLIKSIEEFSSISSVGSVLTTTEINKSSDSSITSLGSLTIDFNKSVAYQSVTSGIGDLITSVQVNKESGIVTIQADGIIITAYIRDFTDTNIIYLNLDVIAEQTSFSFNSIAEQTNKEFTVNAKTMPR